MKKPAEIRTINIGTARRLPELYRKYQYKSTFIKISKKENYEELMDGSEKRK